MYRLKIQVHSYTENTWRHLDKSGEIEISAEVDALSEGSENLKLQVNELLAKVNAENKLLSDVEKIEEEIRDKKKTLRILNNEITTAKSQKNRLDNFLKRLGIDPRGYELEISTLHLGNGITDDSGEIVVVEAEEVDPIPFDRGTNEESHEF